MKMNYAEHSLKAGIYKIVNTHTGRVYIGQASRFKERWKAHQRTLLAGKHLNQFLQNDFNKCKETIGHDDFLEFHVIEVLDDSTKEERNKREECWITQTDNCYNFQVKVVDTAKLAYSQTPEETADKKSMLMRRLWQSPGFKERQKQKLKESWENEGRREKFSNSAKSFWSSTEGLKSRQIVVDARSKEFCVISPQGVVYESKNMSRFCAEHGLSLKHFSALVLGKQKSHKGWQLFKKGAN
jgi:group I intron endonuclease